MLYRNFGQIAIIMPERDLDLKEVHFLGPFPWALAGVMGDLKKTNKATLLNEVKKLTEPLDSLPDAYASIFDGMAIVQKDRTTELTFGELAHQMFQSILSSSRGTKQIVVVFDVYMKFFEVPELESAQEEADTRIMLHVMHATNQLII